ncbi:hypothetical protein L1987_15380 [Smallanthus sonchifolius]|uniref:Uncharacterized protein n=1 Tax=Smallanthus sonchifolius TaxID=185202 RepID=A0ACB9J7L6_9ASTR|nr:hypothetical protein L1987_15380 [Smallanthus sonchifolius]
MSILCSPSSLQGHDLPSYLAHKDVRGNHLAVKDSDTIGASYDFYLRGTVFQLSGDPFVLCFVDFESPAEAATAKDALQGHLYGYGIAEESGFSLFILNAPTSRKGSPSIVPAHTISSS